MAKVASVLELENRVEGKVINVGRLTTEFVTGPQTVAIETAEVIKDNLEDAAREAVIDNAKELAQVVAEEAEIIINNIDEFIEAIERINIGLVNTLLINGEGEFEVFEDVEADIDRATENMNIIDQAEVKVLSRVVIDLEDLLDELV